MPQSTIGSTIYRRHFASVLNAATNATGLPATHLHRRHQPTIYLPAFPVTLIIIKTSFSCHFMPQWGHYLSWFHNVSNIYLIID